MNDILKGKDWIDFSNYPEHHPNYDTTKKGLNGFWKDETEGVPIREVVFLRSKLYSIEREDAKYKQAGKGILGVVQKKRLSHQDYKDCLEQGTFRLDRGHKIQTKNHNIYLVETHKKTLNLFDDKRCTRRKGKFVTHCFGHYKLNRYKKGCR